MESQPEKKMGHEMESESWVQGSGVSSPIVENRLIKAWGLGVLPPILKHQRDKTIMENETEKNMDERKLGLYIFAD